MRILIPIGAWIALATLSGCGFWLRSDYPERRQALLECEHNFGAGSERCESLRSDAEVESERYDAEARQAWGCHSPREDEPCPTPR